MRYLLLFVFCFIPFLHAEEITIDLRTDEPLPSIYLASFKIENSELPKDYVEKLEAILRSDFEICGKAKLLAKSSQREKMAAAEGGWKTFDRGKWLADGTQGVIKGIVKRNTLSAGSFHVKNNKIKGVEEIPLTGDLGKDRVKIHALADEILKAFFGEKGIGTARILYTVTHKTPGSASSQWETNVWESDIDGANAKKVTKGESLCVTPLYIPTPGNKAKAFLYVSYAVGQPKLYAASLFSQGAKRITYLPGNQITPAISPKGDLIAFICDATGNPELYVLPFSPEKGALGKPRLLFSSLAGAQGCPSFNPNGDKIAFVSNKDGKPKIYTIPVHSEGKASPLLLTKKNPNNTSPSWSPDGTKIAYCAWSLGTRQIWIYDFETKKEWQLTEGAEHKENPCFAPNSFHLVYNTSTDEGGELYLVNIKDRKSFKIGTQRGEKRFPSFSP